MTKQTKEMKQDIELSIVNQTKILNHINKKVSYETTPQEFKDYKEEIEQVNNNMNKILDTFILTQQQCDLYFDLLTLKQATETKVNTIYNEIYYGQLSNMYHV